MKKIWKVLLIVLVAYVVFAGVVLALFLWIQKNPVDVAACDYIRDQSTISQEYGEIHHVARKVMMYKTEKKEDYVRAPYSVETDTAKLVVYVTLEKREGIWEAVSYEIVRVEKI